MEMVVCSDCKAVVEDTLCMERTEDGVTEYQCDDCVEIELQQRLESFWDHEENWYETPQPLIWWKMNP
jgi:hypothetical protein